MGWSSPKFNSLVDNVQLDTAAGKIATEAAMHWQCFCLFLFHIAASQSDLPQISFMNGIPSSQLALEEFKLVKLEPPFIFVLGGWDIPDKQGLIPGGVGHFFFCIILLAFMP